MAPRRAICYYYYHRHHFFFFCSSGGPTAAPVADAGTYAWDEDWGDWVGAGMNDMGLNVGWDDMGPYEDPTPSQVQGRGAGGSQMHPQPSAGLS